VTRRREFITRRGGRVAARGAGAATGGGDARSRCLRRYMEDEHKRWNDLAVNADLYK
jgi:hypothetical protein